MSLFKRIRKFISVYRLPYEIKPPYTHIVQAGDPVLRKPAESLRKQDISTPQVTEVIIIRIFSKPLTHAHRFFSLF